MTMGFFPGSGSIWRGGGRLLTPTQVSGETFIPPKWQTDSLPFSLQSVALNPKPELGRRDALLRRTPVFGLKLYFNTAHQKLFR